VSRRAGALALAVLAALPGALAACGDDDDDPVVQPATSVADATAASLEYPPNDIDDLREIFDPLVAPMGLRVTRGALVDRTDGYEASDTGTHLALYVEPVDDATYTIDDYVDGIYDVAAAVTPTVFDRFNVETYDICQEPPTEVDPSDEPFPLSQIEMSRQNYEDYDWASGSLPSFVLFLRETEGARLLVGGDVAHAPAYLDALRDAGYQVPD
jgi:hypothetical protein